MASTITRRPLPALIALLALLLLTALVWWRVMNRDTGTTPAAKTCTTPAAPVSLPTTLPPQKTIDVLVLNATTRTGLAAKVRKALLADGFRSSQRANNDESGNKVTGIAQIRYNATTKPAATLLAYYFPGAQLLQVAQATSSVTVSVGPKYTVMTAQKVVTAKLAANKITLRTTPATPSPTPSASVSC